MTKIIFSENYDPNQQCFSANLKIELQTLEIENFKKHLIKRNLPYYTITKEIKKYASKS